MSELTTLSQTMKVLREEGYVEDFSLKDSNLWCDTKEHEVDAADFHVDKYYRFEGESNPADMSILYAISSPKHSLKGLLVTAYGTYSETVSPEILKKLTID